MASAAGLLSGAEAAVCHYEDSMCRLASVAVAVLPGTEIAAWPTFLPRPEPHTHKQFRYVISAPCAPMRKIRKISAPYRISNVGANRR